MMNETHELENQFFLTYLAFRDNKKMLGHSAVGISKKNKDNTFDLIFRVGLFPTDQVQMEDFILDKLGRDFYCANFPLTLDQATDVMHQINSDRHQFTSSKKNPENKKETQEEKQSKPGGVVYHTYLNNCKDYAMSLLKTADVNYSSIKNSIISIPRFSGKLQKVCLEKTANNVIVIHPHGTKGYYIEKTKQYLEANKNKLESDPKMTAANKLLVILESSNTSSFSKEEYKALQSGRLGSIYCDAIKHSMVNPEKIKTFTTKNKTSFYRLVINTIRGTLEKKSDINVEKNNSENPSLKPK